MKSMLRRVVRNLNLHEYQGADLLSKHGLPTLKGGPARTPAEALSLAKTFPAGAVVKAQIHAGGRGRGRFLKSKLESGVHIFDTYEKLEEIAAKMLNDTLVTKQSGPQGKPVETLFVVEKVNIKKEMYLAVTLNREAAAIFIIASPKGGMGIEEVDPQYVLKLQIGGKQISPEEIHKITAFLEPENPSQAKEIEKIVEKLFEIFNGLDCTMVEINPLGVLADGRVAICDSKINIDDSSEFRHKEEFKLDDISQKNPIEVKAHQLDLSYVKLDGDIGCLVNGAGLAMATMDLINFRGGKPANFLDIGGGATIDRVSEAIEIIESDKDVKSILINIFGGIVRCDLVAEGIIKAAKNLGSTKPIVVRVKGTNADIAKQLIEKSGLKLFWQDDVNVAVDKAVSMAKH